MKSSDILSMALRNLRGRRSRTRLTVIGVIVGTCAIVIMISVGVGINETLTRQYRNSASATRISVYVDTAASEASDKEAPPLDDSAVEFLSGISGVRTVLPVIDMTERVQITRGRYAYTGGSVTALELDRLGELGVTVSGGSAGGTALFGSEEKQTEKYAVSVLIEGCDGADETIKSIREGAKEKAASSTTASSLFLGL